MKEHPSLAFPGGEGGGGVKGLRLITEIANPTQHGMWRCGRLLPANRQLAGRKVQPGFGNPGKSLGSGLDLRDAVGASRAPDQHLELLHAVVAAVNIA